MFGDKLKKIIKKENEEKDDVQSNKKKMENIVFFIIILIITIFAINYILNKNENAEVSNSLNKQLASEENLEMSSENTNIENKLKSILENIQGVSNVSVMVNYSESIETIAMYNENEKTSKTQETDTQGGVRTIDEIDKQKEIVYSESNGDKIPITQKTISPKIEGAIITAKGANNSEVKTRLIEAVEAVTRIIIT